jgi:hypothetical protein
MTISYSLWITRGHLFVDVEGQNVLLDTGSHVSIGRSPNMKFAGCQYALVPSYECVRLEPLSDFIGQRVDVLMGMDILGKHNFLIDIESSMLTVSDEAPEASGIVLPLKLYFGVPGTQVKVAGFDIQAIIDTGAWLSYTGGEYVRGCQKLCSKQDYYPAIGDFETDVYKLPLAIGGEELEMPFGVLPPLLSAGLAPLGVECLIGPELFERFNVWFLMPAAKLILQDRASSSGYFNDSLRAGGPSIIQADGRTI